jgi:hypothetical protein
VLEKPIAHDLARARELGRIVREVFDQSQVFRIDHYLGKEAVQNILVLRLANLMVERAWCARRSNTSRSRSPSPTASAVAAVVRGGWRAARHGPEPPAPGALLRGRMEPRTCSRGRPFATAGRSCSRPCARSPGRSRQRPARTWRRRGTRRRRVSRRGTGRARLHPDGRPRRQRRHRFEMLNRIRGFPLANPV